MRMPTDGYKYEIIEIKLKKTQKLIKSRGEKGKREQIKNKN